jgi:hypothetical protein
VKRGGTLTIEVKFKSTVKVESAFLTWQTYDPISPKQSSTGKSFGCVAEVTPGDGSIEMSCKVPLFVADGRYSLTSLSIHAGEAAREYSFTKDFPSEVLCEVHGGPQVTIPDISSLEVK